MARFEDLDADWQLEEPKTGGKNYENAPDGKYTARVTGSVEERDGNDVIKFRYYFPSLNISETELIYIDPQRKGVIKAKLKALGLIVNKASDIPAAIKQVNDWVVEVEKKTNGKYRNYYVNKVVEKSSPEQEKATSKVDPAVLEFFKGNDKALDDDLPF